MRKNGKFLCSLLCLLTICLPVHAAGFETKEELRAAYETLGDPSGLEAFEEQPSVSAPYSAGTLSPSVRADAIAYLNFLRAIAGLEPVEEDALYTLRAQSGAVLLAADGEITHDAPRPDDMPEAFYESAHTGTMSSDIVRMNWTRGGILRDAIAYFVRDDGESNLDTLGHRRWALNPTMGSTGIGYAVGADGFSYAVLYAHDLSNDDASWSSVCWPSEGVFPVELMHSDLAWSVSLNTEVYSWNTNELTVKLSETKNSVSFELRPGDDGEYGYCAVSDGGYGSGPCLIFRPALSKVGLSEYEQNQEWMVDISGLYSDGTPVKLRYSVQMVSLYAQDVANVELTPTEMTMVVGQRKQLTANIVPEYADDLTLTWVSSDESVAVVDEFGTVTAVAAGGCQISAASANGRSDVCAVNVKPE